MNDRKVGGLAAVVTVAVAAASIGPEIVASRLVGATTPTWLPAFGTAGQTVSVYLGMASAVGPVATWALALGLGYYLGRAVDAQRDHRRLLRALLTGSATAVGLAVAVIGIVTAVGGSLDVGMGVMLVAWLVDALFSYAAPVVVGGYAAAVLTATERDSDRDPRAAAADRASSERVREHAVEDAD